MTKEKRAGVSQPDTSTLRLIDFRPPIPTSTSTSTCSKMAQVDVEIEVGGLEEPQVNVEVSGQPSFFFAITISV